jgi:hypothetical protein
MQKYYNISLMGRKMFGGAIIPTGKGLNNH